MTFGGRDGGGEDCFFFVVATPADAVAAEVRIVQASESHLGTNILSESKAITA